VWKAIHKNKKILCAIKKCLGCFQDQSSAQRMYREIEILSQLQGQENIISLYEVILVTESRDAKHSQAPILDAARDASIKEVYLVFKYVEADLEKVLRAQLVKDKSETIDYIFYKLVRAVYFMHAKKVIHRDIKPSNILIGKDGEPKLADFGLARTLRGSQQEHLLKIVEKRQQQLGGKQQDNHLVFENVKEMNEVKYLTDYVASRWYRAPEILLGSDSYSFSSDIWSLGCVFAEMLLGRVLFPGSSTLNQLEKIFEVIGRPTEEEIPLMGSPTAETMISAVDEKHQISIDKLFSFAKPVARADQHVRELLKKMIVLNPKNRAEAKNLIEDPYFSNFLSSERKVIQFYQNQAGKHPLELQLDDNMLYELKSYEQELKAFVGGKKLKARRFELKDDVAAFRLRGVGVDPPKQTNEEIRSQLSPPRQLQEEEADELDQSKGTDGGRLSHGKSSLGVRPED